MMKNVEGEREQIECGIADLLAKATAQLSEASPSSFLRLVFPHMTEWTVNRSHYWHSSEEITFQWGDNYICIGTIWNMSSKL